MAAENQRYDQPTTGTPRPPAAPPAAVPMPYIPTDKENAYLEACGEAITAGCEFAKSAEAASNAEAYAKFASGVKSLTDAYTAIKHGGNVNRHQGS